MPEYLSLLSGPRAQSTSSHSPNLCSLIALETVGVTSEAQGAQLPRIQYFTSFPTLTLPGGLSVPELFWVLMFSWESASPSF